MARVFVDHVSKVALTEKDEMVRTRRSAHHARLDSVEKARSVLAGVCVLAACSGEAVVTDGSGSSTTSVTTGGVGGRGGQSTGSTGTTVSMVAIGAGGGEAGGSPSPCAGGAFINVEPLGAMEGIYTNVCGWGAKLTDCTVGYRQTGPSAGVSIVIEGCLESPTSPDFPENQFRLVAPTDALAVGTYHNVELTAGIYWSNPAATSVTITKTDDVGGIIEGTFETVLLQLDQAIEATGTFRVVRVNDFAAP